MRRARGHWRVLPLALAAVLLVALFRVVGYSWLVATDSSASALAALPVPDREQHDVVVLSVKVSQPTATRDGSAGATGLLVAIDNRGTETETGLVVEARVAADGQAQAATPISTPTGALAPGEVRVVRLDGLSEQLVRSGCWLTVLVRPARADVVFANNSKTVWVGGPASPGPN